MPYLVDGNNVMAQRVGWHRDKPGARRDLLDALARFAQAKGMRVAVVFDGAPEQHFPDGSGFRGVRVYYGERGSNADERIKQMAEATRERRTLTVVTSDRALADYVRRLGVQVLRAGEFRRRIDDTLTKTDKRAKESEAPTGVASEEVDGWMRYFGVAPEDDDDRLDNVD
jgi:predicted RNA-binding protein with PIN domain